MASHGGFLREPFATVLACGWPAIGVSTAYSIEGSRNAPLERPVLQRGIAKMLPNSMLKLAARRLAMRPAGLAPIITVEFWGIIDPIDRLRIRP